MQRKVALISSLFFANCLTSGFAQGPAPSPLLSPAPVLQPAAPLPELALPHELTKPDLEAFLDALIPAQLQNRDIAGAVVAVVKDGQILLSKGYGYADFTAKKPVVADQTLFRPGSISKVFTTTAVLQLVEQGKLDLDRDVNDYLDFAIPKTYPEPITLRRILTHTAGFEETVKNLFVPSAREMRPLREYLIAAMPARIFPPGAVPSYSNYALTIAGYIVERISGEPFDKYVAAHILTPLKMDHSTFAQPLPETLEPNMSQGYLAAAQGPRKFEFVTASPAGALSATAHDMTRFMLALLGEGTFDGATILKPESVRAMESRQFELHPALHAMGLVLMDYSMNGQRIFGHGGDTIFFHSDMIVMPDAHLGLFISYNSAGSRLGGGRTEVIRTFLNRYFPEPVTALPAIDLKTAQADGRAVSGVYTGSRRSESTLLKVTAVLGQAAVTSDEKGVLTVEGVQSPRGGLKRWREIGPLVYREVDGPDVIAFRRDANGVVTDLLPAMPIQLAQRVTGLASKKVLLPVLGASQSLIVLTLLLWPVAVIVRKRYGRPLFTSALDRILYVFTRIDCLLQIIFVALILLPLSLADKNIGFIGDGVNPWLSTAHIFGWLAAAGLVIVASAAVRSWRVPGLGWWARVHATLLLIAGVIFMSFAWWNHLLSPSLRF
ncbi:MAG TPA: serine hydrolase domain-containing protein [Chthoniobacterales bacterium]|nr:serine hydrolase domain-containing protein [Chthoniobacterales bacterium]